MEKPNRKEANMDEISKSKTRKISIAVNIILIILLISTNIWFFYKIQLLEKTVVELHSQNEKIERNVNRVDSDVDLIYSAINRLDFDVGNIYSAVNLTSSRLDYVIPLAENANRWAHSHGW